MTDPLAPISVVVADDSGLMRDGLSMLLRLSGIEVVGTAGDARGLLQRVAAARPDVALIDIRMPPTMTDEGLVAARRIRAEHPSTAVLVLSNVLDPGFALDLIEDGVSSVGYLLKDTVENRSALVQAIQRVAAGECVVDPHIVRELIDRRRGSRVMNELSTREQEVLAVLAEGYTNAAISERLDISPRTTETHLRNIFIKLDLRDSEDTDKRVKAVLMYLAA